MLHGRAFTILACLFTMGSMCNSPVFAASVGYYGPILGKLNYYRIDPGDTLIEIARRSDVGYNAIVAANPGVDPFIPPAGTTITLPTAWIPPKPSTRPSIVVNLPEYRLYFFDAGRSDVLTFPLGIGDEGTDTPVGRYTVIQKIVNPFWTVPPSIRSKNSRLPRVVPPGPHNPLGTHALRLSKSDILIHGTNRPWGIGRRSSHGCIRLYPEDITRLFGSVPKGARVEIVNHPLKVAVEGKKVFVEVHHYEAGVTVGRAMRLLLQAGALQRTDFAKLTWAVAEKRGVPVDVTLAHSPPGVSIQGYFLGRKGVSFQKMRSADFSSALSFTPFCSMRF